MNIMCIFYINLEKIKCINKETKIVNSNKIAPFSIIFCIDYYLKTISFFINNLIAQ